MTSQNTVSSFSSSVRHLPRFHRRDANARVSGEVKHFCSLAVSWVAGAGRELAVDLTLLGSAQ